MRVTFIVITLVVISVSARSSCLGGLVNIFPRNAELISNPVILVEFSEQDYQLYARLNNQSFTLITPEGKSIPLRIWKKNKSHKNLAQILLKPSKVLPANSIVSFHFRATDTIAEMTRKFVEVINSYRWNTIGIIDIEPPVLQTSVNCTYVDRLNWSSSYHGFNFEFKITDENLDTYERSGMEFSTILAEVKDGRGNRYILPVTNNLLLIYDGNCGSIFDLNQDTSYEFKFRLMDFSGNWSKTTLVADVDK